MRQRRWLELVKDYDCEILYHPGKANVVADALSRKGPDQISNMVMISSQLASEMTRANIELVTQKLFNLTLQSDLLERIKMAQLEDPELVKTREDVLAGKAKDFSISDNGMLLFKARVCVPDINELKKEILEEAHTTPYSLHPGTTKMYQDLKPYFWWYGMKRDVVDYVTKCLTCQQIKAEHQRPAGLLQPLTLPEWKWEDIAMDFVVGLPRTTGMYDSVWVVVDRFTKSAHFLPVKVTYSVDQYADLYVKEIVRLHGVPKSIVSDRDPKFTSKFWMSLQKAMGTNLKFSTAFHPQTDGQSERTIQILEDLLRACVMDFGGSWSKYLPLIEFSYNNSYQSTIGMAPYELLYGRKCRSPIHWDETGERKYLGPELVQKTNEAIDKIKARMLASQSRQKSYADPKRRDVTFQPGDHVFLRVSPMKGIRRFGKKGKLSPRFIGPFEILEKVGQVAYRLALPPSLSAVHNVFHVSMLRKYVFDPMHVLSYEALELQPDLSYDEQPVQILDKKEKVLRTKTISLVKVLWRNSKVEEATWELESDMRTQHPELFR